MRTLPTILALALAAIPALARISRTGEMEYHAQAGLPLNGGSGRWITGGQWATIETAEGLRAWGQTNGMTSIQIWTARESPTMTLSFGARSSGPIIGLSLLACPGYDPAATNLTGATTNWFQMFDGGFVGAWYQVDGVSTFASNSIAIINPSWEHFAVEYCPTNGLWIWWKNGVRQGTTNTPARKWTGPWKAGSAFVLQHFGLPVASSNGDLRIDCLAASQTPSTDASVYRDYLGWKTRRYGMTEDDPFSLAFSVVGIPRVVPDSTVVRTNLDAIVWDNTWAATRFDQMVNVSVSRGAATWGMAVDNGYTISACGIVSNTENGIATVTVSATNDGEKVFTRAFEVPVALTEDAESNAVYRTGVSGSLRKSCSDWINSRVGTGQRSLWTTWDPATTNYIRSTNTWTKDAVGIDAASVWNSRRNDGGASPTLVAPDLVIGCAHAILTNGHIIRWIGPTNQVIESTVQANSRLAVYPAWPDVSILRISPVVTNIPFVKLVPTNATTRLSVQPDGIGYGMPAVKLSQTGRVDTLDLVTVSTIASYAMSEDTNRAAYGAWLQNGDSGNPCFWIIDGTATLANVWTTYTSGAFLGAISDDAFTAAAVAVGSTNRITRANVDSFTEYP